MVGLMQIMIYMLAVYLVYKGVEIFQIALMSSRHDRFPGILIGVAAFCLACVLAVPAQSSNRTKETCGFQALASPTKGPYQILGFLGLCGSYI